MYARGQVLPPGIHFFVKILTFKNIYFLRITADLYETSQFYYFKYDKSDRKLHFLIKQIFKKNHCTGNPFIVLVPLTPFQGSMVRVTGSSSADTICELSLFDVLFSYATRVSSLRKNQHVKHCKHRILNVVVVSEKCPN
jgi:hypothetical protein